MEDVYKRQGPHRDDMLFSVDDVDIRKFGSQGQQRTSALSLKLSEIDLVRRSIHDTPVLLLDDVLSELDSNRQNYLLNSIAKIPVSYTHLWLFRRSMASPSRTSSGISAALSVSRSWNTPPADCLQPQWQKLMTPSACISFASFTTIFAFFSYGPL